MANVSQISSKRRLRRIKYLSEELIDTKEIISHTMSEVLGIVGKLHAKLGHKTDKEEKRRPKPYLPNQRNKEVEMDDVGPPPPWAKRLYREIAKVTHPDKMSSLGLSPEKVKESEEMLVAANAAETAGDWNALIDIAIQLEIIDCVAEDMTFAAAMSSREKELDKALREQKESFFWHWVQAGDDEKMRVKMINAYMESAGYSAIDEATILATLRGE